MLQNSDVIVGMQAPGAQQVVTDSQNTMMRPHGLRKPRYVSGAHGLSRALGISSEQAQQMIDSGAIAEAVQTCLPQGIIIIDWEKAARLWEESCRVSSENE